MQADKMWDHAQDIAKLFLSGALLVASPEIHLPIKIATIGIGALNRVVKIKKDLPDERNAAQTISDEQRQVFEKAWERTRGSMELHSRAALADELSDVLNFKVDALSSYTETDLERVIEETASNPGRFIEWYVGAGDYRAVLDRFWEYYEEELLKTDILLKYYSRLEIKELMLILSQLINKIGYLEDMLRKIREALGEVPYDLTDSDLSRYFARLSRYAKSDRNLYADLPVKDCYRSDIHELLGRIAEPTWKQEACQLFDEMLGEAAPDSVLSGIIRENIEAANGNVEYTAVLDILNTLDGMTKWSYRIGNKADALRKGFDKVALVSGEPGAGKTHFLRDCIIHTLDEKSAQVFLIPLEYEDVVSGSQLDTAYFEAFLLDRVNTCFGTSLSKLKRLAHNTSIRIVFLIDNINRIFLHEHKAFLRIISGIKELTRYDFLCWLITVNEFDLYMLDNDERIIQDYCFDFHQNGGLFNKTFNLTAFNEKTSLGGKILSLYNIELSPMAGEAAGAENYLDDCFCSPVNNPLYAHILGASGADEAIPYTAAYLSFITELTGYVDKNIKKNFPVKYSSIKSAVLAAVELALGTGSIDFYSTDLDKACGPDNIPVLQAHNLLRRLGEVKDEHSKRNLEDIYQLYTSIYWVLKTVQHLAEDDTDCAGVYEKLKCIGEYRGELFPCYLLFLDHRNRYDECTRVIQMLKDDSMLQYALFPSVKASRAYKVKLMSILKEDGEPHLSAPETFALIYYLYCYNAKMSDKFYVLNKYMESVHTHGLMYNLELLVDKLLLEITSLPNLKKNIVPLFGGKISDINHLLGYKAGARYFTLNSEEPADKQMYSLIDYIKQNNLSKLTGRAPDGFSFLDYFTRSYFTYLITDRKIGLKELYSIAEEQGRFFDSNNGLVIRRNFACAAGNVYEFTRSDEYRLQFMEIVADIMDSEDPAEYIFAFHFISNSVGGHGDRVDEEFIPFLETMWADPRMERFCRNSESRRAFFVNNMSEATEFVEH